MKRILFICGSLNQTTMMHKISKHLDDFKCHFTPYYGDNYLDKLASKGLLDFTIFGGEFKKATLNYLWNNNLNVDYYGNSYNYDLVLTCSDLLIPKNVLNKNIILVQEGMTDPKNILFYLVKWFNLPRYLASTSTLGMSNAYDYFCVASEGYKQLFVENGIEADKIIVTGIPNFDNCVNYYNNSFPYKNFVLVATSDARETYKFENRKKFILEALKIAGDKQLIFKLHPNENFDRAIKEINKYTPNALVYTYGNVHEMIANCDVLITKYSTSVYTGIILGKTVYSDFDLDVLKKLAPLQNGGTSALNIANICRQLINKNRKNEMIEKVNKTIRNYKYKPLFKPIKISSKF